MNVYKELVEIDEMKEKNSDLKDKILDYYNNNPKECNSLLKELVSIDEELNDLEKTFKKIENEVY
jgi:predicted  nucleic acid-binding Zn-ribbon protein